MRMNDTWYEFLFDYFQLQEYNNLKSFVEREYNHKIIYPQIDKVFNAFDLVEPHKVKVVLLGQDPYHGANQANGLAFSVNGSILPPSLKNIFKELVDDVGCSYPLSGDLSPWAYNGVLLLNTVLTVENGKPHSHKGRGWENFTNYIIAKLSKNFQGVVFLLWGNDAKNKIKFIDSSKHCILHCAHPSPLSAYRGFFGFKPFSKVNKYLLDHNKEEIQWCL